jgi:hypothetical protein
MTMLRNGEVFFLPWLPGADPDDGLRRACGRIRARLREAGASVLWSTMEPPLDCAEIEFTWGPDIGRVSVLLIDARCARCHVISQPYPDFLRSRRARAEHEGFPEAWERPSLRAWRAALRLERDAAPDVATWFRSLTNDLERLMAIEDLGNEHVGALQPLDLAPLLASRNVAVRLAAIRARGRTGQYSGGREDRGEELKCEGGTPE